MDNYNIRYPLCQDRINGAASTHGLNMVGKKIANGQNRNTGTAEVGSEVVAEPRGARAEASRRTEGRKMLSEEMLMAYEELEREMSKLRNSIGKRTNPSDLEALSGWRE